MKKRTVYIRKQEMKTSTKKICTGLIILVLIFWMTQPAAAQQRATGPKQPAPAGQPVQPSVGMPEPLVGPIQLEPSKVKKLTKPEPLPVEFHR